MAGNWSGGAVPGAADTAVFNIPGAYTVAFNSNHVNQRLAMRNGEVTFDLQGMTYQLTKFADHTIYSIVVGESNGDDALLTLTDGTLHGVEARIGYFSGSHGKVTVDGATWTNDNQLEIGVVGTGELIVENGGSVTGTSGVLGYGIGSHGSATVANDGSQWTSTGSLTVGNMGAGELTIADGGTVSSAAGSIGANSGSQGVVTVMGGGSAWTNNGPLNIGRVSGELIIEDGGAVSSAGGYLGQVGNQLATVEIAGDGSTWTNSSGLYVSYGGGVAELTITDGGSVTSANSYVGVFNTGEGAVTVTGIGSTWINSGDLDVGDDGAGSLRVESGGSVTTRNLFAARSSLLGNGSISANGAVLDEYNLSFNDTYGVQQTVSFGAGGQLNLDIDGTGVLGAGYRGIGSITIAEGVAVSSTEGFLGANGGSQGTATVTGNSSLWNNSNSLYVGRFGEGNLTIENGAAVANAKGYIGAAAIGQGTAIVTGEGSAWTNSDSLYVGDSGTGHLTIESGGSVTNTAGYIGREINSQGAVTVTGGDSAWTNSSGLYVGYNGDGELTITDGANVSSTYVEVGATSASQGTAIVTGDGSTWTASSSFDVGHGGAGEVAVEYGGQIVSAELNVGSFGTGELTIAEGGDVSSVNGHIGRFAGSQGTVTVSGAGSQWTNSGLLKFGDGGGTLLVEDGGLVSAQTLYGSRDDLFGDGVISVNGVVLDDANLVFNDTYGEHQILSFGAGGQLQLHVDGTGDLGVGYRGTGTMTFAEGVAITSQRGVLGDREGSHGTATVTGAGTSWSNAVLDVGDGGEGSIFIEAGGSVHSASANVGKSGTGTVSVSGASSTWVVDGILDIGLFGSADLGILDGGNVSNELALLGNFGNEQVNTTVSGANSTWSSDDLEVYSGMLKVENGGTVNVSGTLQLLGGELSGNGGAVAGNVVNSAGVVAPGNSAGGLTINGAFTQTAGGVLQIELGGTTALIEYDRLVITGAAALGGTLDVDFFDDFTPSAGQSFDILNWNSRTGAFSHFDLPPLELGLAWDISALYSDGILGVVVAGPGDFNGDDEVDGADFLAWQRGLSNSPLSAGDLADWEANYGIAAVAARPVPEPSALVLFGLAAAGLVLAGRLR